MPLTYPHPHHPPHTHTHPQTYTHTLFPIALFNVSQWLLSQSLLLCNYEAKPCHLDMPCMTLQGRRSCDWDVRFSVTVLEALGKNPLLLIFLLLYFSTYTSSGIVSKEESIWAIWCVKLKSPPNRRRPAKRAIFRNCRCSYAPVSQLNKDSDNDDKSFSSSPLPHVPHFSCQGYYLVPFPLIFAGILLLFIIW